MSKASYVYVVYIATTPDEVWQALTSPEFSARYWFGRRATSDWKPGSKVNYWQDATQKTLDFRGIVLRSEPPKILSYTFGEVDDAGRTHHGEPPSRVTYEIQPLGALVRLTMTHDELEACGKLLPGVSKGWPTILSGLKTLLETGAPITQDFGALAVSHQR